MPATDSMTIGILGEKVEEAMNENGGDRNKAIQNVLHDDVLESREVAYQWWQAVGADVLAEAHRQFRNGHARGDTEEDEDDNEKPSQLQSSKNDGVNVSSVHFPTGRSGEYKDPTQITKADVQAQLATYRATVSGLENRIESGKQLMRLMNENDTLRDTIEREGDVALEAAEEFYQSRIPVPTI